jgi:hypothetical protein
MWDTFARRTFPMRFPSVARAPSRFALASLALAAFGCAGPAPEALVSEDEFGVSEAELLRKTSDTGAWLYQGLLPKLDEARITVSLAGHTARVTGLLPANFTGTLPFYAVRESEPSKPGRTRVTVVYPVATGNPNTLTEEGLPVRNIEPGTYATCAGTMGAATTEKASFGGFPFVEYVCRHVEKDGRVRTGIAFHGPITAATREAGLYWSLLRGPVSHGCNRMLGEHVLELARLVGFDQGVRGTPVTVVAGFDTFRGRAVDVDYPSTGFARPASSASVVFPTWQAVTARADGSLSVDFPQWACEASRCASMPPNRLDPRTGEITPMALRCLPGFAPTRVAGGTATVCASQDRVQGAFTRAAIGSCKALRLGATCNEPSWRTSFALRMRGGDVCPRATFFDALTGACIDGDEALGPFPRDVVEKCVSAKQSRATCEGMRWNRWTLLDFQRRPAIPVVAVR